MIFNPKKSSPPQRRKRYDREPSEWQKGWNDFKEEYPPNKIAAAFVIISIISVFLSGYAVQSVLVMIDRKSKITLGGIIQYGIFSLPGILITIVLIMASSSFIFWILRRYKKSYHTDRERNYQISDMHTYGDADYQDEYEIRRCCYRTDDPNNIKNNLDILGRGIEDNLLYSLRDDLKSMNGHMCIMGSSGSGKSAAFVTNKIYQCLKRGVSMVVTDSKGDLYANTAKLAKKMGYKVKMLNLKSDQLMNSDGCDFFKTLGDDDSKAQTLAETIIKNTEGDESLDYFAKNELNLLKALILYVSTNDALIKTKRNNLAEIFNIVSTKSLEEMHQIFGLLDSSHPAKQAFNIFAACEPKVQGQIHNGMAIRLQILSNKWAKHIVSSDDIDLIEPMKSKCIYYVVISDTETAYKFIATLFFADIFIEECGYYDRVSQKCRELGIENPCIPVEFILDEFANTGAIPEFNVKIATVRSRQIGITIIIQDIGQLKDMYGENLAYTILNNMPLKMLLKTTDINTAKYFSDLMGIQTVRVEQRRYERAATDIVQSFDRTTVSEGIGKRPLMNPDEIINSLDSDHLLLCISGFHPLKLKKFMFFEHPMTKECEFTDPGGHVPRWRKIIDKERAAKGLPPIWIPRDDIDIPGSKKQNKKKPTGTAKPSSKPAPKKKPAAPEEDTPRTPSIDTSSLSKDEAKAKARQLLNVSTDNASPPKKNNPKPEKPRKAAPEPELDIPESISVEESLFEDVEIPETDNDTGGYTFDDPFPEEE